MSLCLIVRDESCILIGADTAVSQKIDGKSYRVKDDFREKVFCVDGHIIFCSGLLYVSDQIKAMILQSNKIDTLQIQTCVKELVRQLPAELNNKDHETGIIICTPDGDVISMVQERDFKIETQKKPDVNGTQVLAGGFDADRAQEIASTALLGDKDILDVFGVTFATLASNSIGGDLILYCLDIENKKIERQIYGIKEPVEKLNYVYQHCEFKGNVYANDLFLSGKNVLNNLKDKITGEHLDLEGVHVRNGGQNSMTVKDGVIQFGTGINSITIQDGKVYINPGVSLNWGSIEGAPELALKSDIPDYIQNTHIDGAKILSPTIAGGEFYGAKYWNLTNNPDANKNPTGDTYLTMNSNGYFEIVQNGKSVLRLGKSANVGEKAVRFFGFDDNDSSPFMGYNWTQQKVYGFKDWDFTNAGTVDFTNANVRGVTAVFG